MPINPSLNSRRSSGQSDDHELAHSLINYSSRSSAHLPNITSFSSSASDITTSLPFSPLSTSPLDSIQQNGTDSTTNGAVGSRKRADYLNWDEFFMGTALLAAQRSKDPSTQVSTL